MDYVNVLDEILLSNNVVDNFYNKYSNDVEFKNWLDNVLPEINMCELQQQNNPWHKYNVLGHILHSVEEINKQTTNLDFDIRRMLAYIMLYHDIGKPACYITREKDGKIIDSFYNHNVESEKVFGRTASVFGFNHNQIEIMAKLIFKHDIFMFIRAFKTDNPYWRTLTYKLVKEEIEDLNTVGNGCELLKYLIMVGRSDNRAQNEKMTADSLKLLDKFDEMLENVARGIK